MRSASPAVRRARRARQASNDLGISIATSLDALPEKEFDAITLWEVIEHLREPIVELRRLRDHLRPGGMLMLSTPNNGHWQAVRAPDLWIGYRPPSHLLYFTAGTLTDALKRSGFERIQIHRVAPLPPLPRWLNRATASLQHGLATGDLEHVGLRRHGSTLGRRARTALSRARAGGTSRWRPGPPAHPGGSRAPRC